MVSLKQQSLPLENISRGEHVNNIVHSSSEIFVLVLVLANEFFEKFVVCDDLGVIHKVADQIGDALEVIPLIFRSMLLCS